MPPQKKKPKNKKNPHPISKPIEVSGTLHTGSECSRSQKAKTIFLLLFKIRGAVRNTVKFVSLTKTCRIRHNGGRVELGQLDQLLKSTRTSAGARTQSLHRKMAWMSENLHRQSRSVCYNWQSHMCSTLICNSCGYKSFLKDTFTT